MFSIEIVSPELTEKQSGWKPKFWTVSEPESAVAELAVQPPPPPVDEKVVKVYKLDEKVTTKTAAKPKPGP